MLQGLDSCIPQMQNCFLSDKLSWKGTSLCFRTERLEKELCILRFEARLLRCDFTQMEMNMTKWFDAVGEHVAPASARVMLVCLYQCGAGVPEMYERMVLKHFLTFMGAQQEKNVSSFCVVYFGDF